MNIEEAIEILKIDTEHLIDEHPDSNLAKAQQLGIEALERIKKMRENHYPLRWSEPLPSEIEERRHYYKDNITLENEWQDAKRS